MFREVRYTGGENWKALIGWVEREFAAVAQGFFALERVRFVELHVEPDKPRDGDVVFADGTDWDPGGGKGFYGYYTAAWHKLG